MGGWLGGLKLKRQRVKPVPFLSRFSRSVVLIIRELHVIGPAAWSFCQI